MPASDRARGIARFGRLVDQLIIQQADGLAPRQLRRNGTQQRLGGERIEFLLLQRHKLIVALPVTIGLLPIRESSVEWQDRIPVAFVKTGTTLAGGVDHRIGDDALFRDVVAILLVRCHVGIIGQESEFFGCELE